jgi:hypothetical protein
MQTVRLLLLLGVVLAICAALEWIVDFLVL